MPLDPRIPMGVQPLNTGDIFVAARDREREEEERRQRMELRGTQMRQAEQGIERNEREMSEEDRERAKLRFFHKTKMVSNLLNDAKPEEANQVLLTEMKNMMDSGVDPEAISRMARVSNLIRESPVEAANYFNENVVPPLEQEYGKIVEQSLRNENLRTGGDETTFSPDLIVDTSGGSVTTVGYAIPGNRGSISLKRFDGSTMDQLGPGMEVVPAAAYADSLSQIVGGRTGARVQEQTALGDAETDVLSRREDLLYRQEVAREIELDVNNARNELQATEDQYALANTWMDNIEQNIGPLTVGFGSISQIVPGTPAKDMAANIESLRSTIGIDQINQMREQGGSPGQVTEREWPKFESLLGSLDQGQSPEQFRQNVAAVRRAFDILVNRDVEEFNRLYPDENRQSPAPGQNGTGSGTQQGGSRIRYRVNPDTGELEEVR